MAWKKTVKRRVKFMNEQKIRIWNERKKTNENAKQVESNMKNSKREKEEE